MNQFNQKVDSTQKAIIRKRVEVKQTNLQEEEKSLKKKKIKEEKNIDDIISLEEEKEKMKDDALEEKEEEEEEDDKMKDDDEKRKFNMKYLGIPLSKLEEFKKKLLDLLEFYSASSKGKKRCSGLELFDMLKFSKKKWLAFFNREKDGQEFINDLQESYFNFLMDYGKRIDTISNTMTKRSHDYLNNVKAAKELGKALKLNDVKNGNEKSLVTLNQFYGAGKSEFINSLLISNSRNDMNLDKPNLVIKYKLAQTLKIPKNIDLYDFEHDFLQKNLEKIFFSFIFPELHIEWFDYYYENELSKNIHEWVKGAENSNTIFAIDEIGTLTEAVFDGSDMKFSFGTNLERTYQCWNTIFRYQLIDGLTIVVIGKSTKFSIIGTRKERSPSKSKQIFLDQFSLEDINRLVAHYKKELKPNMIDDLAKNILIKTSGHPRYTLAMIVGESINLTDEMKKFDGLYKYFLEHPIFKENETIPLSEVKEFLNDMSTTDKGYKELEIRKYELISNLGIPISFCEKEDDKNFGSRIMQADVPLIYFNSNRDILRLYEDRLHLTGSQFMEVLSGDQLAHKSLSKSNYKFLDYSSFSIPEYDGYTKLNYTFKCKPKFDKDDAESLMQYLNTIELNSYQILKIDTINVSFADELLFIPYEENGNKFYYMLGIQDKYYLKSSLEASMILTEFNKIAKLISFGYENIKCVALLLSVSEKNNFKVTYLEKCKNDCFKLNLDHVNFQDFDHLANVDKTNFEGFVLTEPFLNSFYDQRRIEVLMTKDKSIKEAYEKIYLSLEEKRNNKQINKTLIENA